MTQNDERRIVGNKHGDTIQGELIYIQAYKINCHKKPRSYSTHRRQTGEARKKAEAWVVKKLRFQSEQ